MGENLDFLRLAAERYSVRKFEERAVEKDALEKIAEAGRLAPTACNLQPQRILVIDGEEDAARLRKCTMSHFGAKTALLVCCDTSACWVREYDGKRSGEVDASIVATQMMLEAWSLGVGSTWVMHFIPEAVREEFALPETFEPVAILVLGYPAEDAKPYPAHASRKPAGETVFYHHFSQKPAAGEGGN